MHCELLSEQKRSCKYDVFCFGLSLIEMISSNMSIPKAFKIISKIIKSGEKEKILEYILDDDLREFLSRALEEDPDKRASIEELLEHKFLVKQESDHRSVKLSNQLNKIVSKYYNSNFVYLRIA